METQTALDTESRRRDTRSPYDTLIGKSKDGVIRELEQLLGASEITLAEGSRWLLGQRAPYGPIMGERDVSFVYKCVWGLYAAGVDHCYIEEMLDWLFKNALRPNGDFFFAEEPPGTRIPLRAYRPLVFLKFASLLDHRLARESTVLQRILQYQDAITGGCFHYIGEDPSQPELPDSIAVAETAFFGEFALAAGLKDEALKAGSWMLNLIQDNAPHMRDDGVFYCLADRDGKLVTQVNPGEKFVKTVNNWDANQAGWNIGCAMVFVADLYDTMRDQWGFDVEETQEYLDAAIALLDFEDTMPLYTYFFPSKCKVAWGTGALLRVLLKYGLGSQEQLDQLYRANKRVFVYTFLGSQLPDGSWPPVNYPGGDDAPELQFDYRVLKGLTLNSPEEIKGSTTSFFLPAVEITGEFLGEIGSMAEGVRDLLEYYRQK